MSRGNFSAGNAGGFAGPPGGNRMSAQGFGGRMDRDHMDHDHMDRGRGDHDRGDRDHGRGRFAFGFGYPDYSSDYYYSDSDYGYDPSCYQDQQVRTRYGWRWRRIWVCD
jgi:hypothetical protein